MKRVERNLKESIPEEIKKQTPLGKLLIWLTILGFIFGVIGIFPIIFNDKSENVFYIPYSVSTNENYFDVKTKLNNVIWSGQVDGRISSTAIVDINNDNYNEVIIGVGSLGNDTGKIICYSNIGKKIWEYNTNEYQNYNGGSSGKLSVHKFVIDKIFNNTNQIVIISLDSQGWYQSKVSIIDDEGKLVSYYWHPGIIGNIRILSRTKESKKYIFIDGVNNDLGSIVEGSGYVSCIFQMDETSWGEAPPYLGNIGKGKVNWYNIISPKGTIITRLEAVDINHTGENIVCLWTDKGNIFYLDFSGKVIGKSYADGYTEENKIYGVKLKNNDR